MPELVEVLIMKDFINSKSDKIYKELFFIEKGNQEHNSNLITNFKIESFSSGKDLKIKLKNDEKEIIMSFFMGMSGNWKYVPTSEWKSTKFCRLRIDNYDNYSLLLYGGYLGPRYKVGNFNGVKRGPDPFQDYNNFRKHILDNLYSKKLEKPLGESLLNQEFFNGIGAYLASEILGRSNINPHKKITELSHQEVEELIFTVNRCCSESYEYGGAELKDWKNPSKESNIDGWLCFYGKRDICHKYKFGQRNIWIKKQY
jgi:formamidopyrimidine-DNA glycosylase